MALGDYVKFAEVHGLLQLSEDETIISYPGMDPVVWMDVRQYHRFTAEILVHSAMGAEVRIMVLSAPNDEPDPGDINLAYSTPEIDLTDYEGDLILLDFSLQQQVDGSRAFPEGHHYVAVAFDGASGSELSLIVMGSGPRYKPPLYPEDADQWVEFPHDPLATMPNGGGGL